MASDRSDHHDPEGLVDSGGWTMDDGPLRRQRWSGGSASAGGRWRYEGIGWPRDAREIRPSVLGVVALVALTIWGYVSIGPNGRLLPGRTEEHRTDFTVFPEAGAAFFDGRHPYRVTNPRGWHYLYPPLFALLVSPLSQLDTESQVVTWYVVNIVLAFGCLVEVRRLWRLVSARVPGCPTWPVTCALLSAFLPFLDCMQAGQLGIGILYFLLLGFRLVLRDASHAMGFLGGLLLALPAAIKLVPSLPVAFLLFHRWTAVLRPRSGRREWSRAAMPTAGVFVGVVLFLLVIPAAIIGWRANLAYLREWRARIVTNQRVGPNANFNIHSFRNQSLANAIYLWDKEVPRLLGRESRPEGAPDRPERVVHGGVRVLIGLILAALLMIGCSLGRRIDLLDQSTAFGLACCATLLVSPLSWGHYYMAQAPAVLLVPLWLLRRGRVVRARIAAMMPPIVTWSYYLAMPYTGGLGLLGLGTTAWFLGSCGSILANEVAIWPASGRLGLQLRRLRSDPSHRSADAAPHVKPTTAVGPSRADDGVIRVNDRSASRR
jgi:hypothetical protein